MKKHFLLLLAIGLIWASILPAQTPADMVVPITVTTNASPASITLSFPAVASATQTFIGRKLVNETAWSFLALPGAATTFTDNSVAVGVGFEYIVVKVTTTTPTQRIGLVYAGIGVQPTTYRGKIVLVVDDALSAPLASELNRYVQDLRGDGWQVLRHDINVATSSIGAVKNIIRTDYQNDPGGTVAAFLFGNIPVPYSGEMAPDGHVADHLGAWPTDYYYGDMDEAGWTDNTVNNTTAARIANRNVPGDGKFDQSQTPTLPELVVSRVDFSNLTAGWDVSQTELYRRYLNKNHAFRAGDYKPSNQTIIDDNFGFFGGEAFAQNGFRNGYALTGASSVVQGDFITDTKNQSFLVGHGCGAGAYTSAAGVATSANFQTDSINVVFSMLFGSYFGDWDSENNPLMPSALASKGGILTCTWAGRPNWHFHHMGLGEPIMTSTYWVWLNSFLGNARVYPPSTTDDELIHVGLLGDPTLRAHALRPVQNAVATASCETINLSWDASPDGQFGYLIYWAEHPDSVYQLIGGVDAPATSFVDSFPVDGGNHYLVRTIKLENVPTGSYYNQSTGVGASVNFGAEPFSVDASATHVTCNGDANGTAVLTITGGSGLTYSWSNNETTQNLSDLAPGTYTVTVSDAQNCTSTAEVTITEPEELGVGAVVNAVSCFGSSDGSINLNVSGGTLPYNYEWSNSETTQNLSGLSAGTFSVTVTDGSGCQGIATDEVTEPSEIDFSLSATDADCNGAESGSIQSSVSGGVPGYEFIWSNSETSETLSNLAAGTYTATITDTNGCTRSESATVGEPSAITASTTTTEAGCAGATNGTVQLTVDGGAPGYTYEWSNSSTEQNLDAVASGTYTVTITDNSGCTQTASATVGQNTTLVASTSATPASCYDNVDGSVSVQADGGTPNYMYKWSGGETQASVNDLGAGTYTVTVTDDAGCSQTATATVGQPDEILAGAVWEAEACATDIGTVTLNISGGTPNYTFAWSTNETTQNLENIPPGIHTVTATDANGCTVVISNSVVQPPPPLSVSTAFEQATCPGVTPLLGNVFAFVVGGSGSYTYNWSNSATTESLTNVPAGPYTVTVTDVAGCTAVHENAVSTLFDDWDVAATATDTKCHGDNNGSVTLSVSGATGPTYAYDWSNSSTNQNLTNVPAGVYTVTITDLIGCTTTETAQVGQPDQLAATVGTSADVTCPGRTDGQASMVAGGGTPGYTYLWSNGGTNAQNASLPVGQSGFTVTDANGCTATATVTIGEPTPPTVAIVGADTACVDGTMLYSLPGSVANFQWTVSGNGTITQGQGTSQLEVLWQTPGTGTVTGAYTWSANNCPDDVSLTIAVKVCVGTNDPTLPGVRVQPNPFGTHLSVLFDRQVQPGAQLRLLDVHGKLISEQTAFTETTRLETAHLPAGAYVLQVLENGRVGVWKVMKVE